MSSFWIQTCSKVGSKRTAAASRETNLDRGLSPFLIVLRVLVDIPERRLASCTGFGDRNTNSHLPCAFFATRDRREYVNVRKRTKLYKSVRTFLSDDVTCITSIV